MKLVTARKLNFKTVGGIPFTVPAGAEVEYHKGNNCYYIKPDQLPPRSLEKHDATYYGLRVYKADIKEKR